MKTATACTCVGEFTTTPTGLDWRVTLVDPECPYLLHRAVA